MDATHAINDAIAGIITSDYDEEDLVDELDRMEEEAQQEAMKNKLDELILPEAPIGNRRQAVKPGTCR